MSLSEPRHRRLAALACALALLAGGCGSQTEEPAAAPTAEDPRPQGGDDSGAAGGTTMRVYRVSEARSAGEGSLHVVGLLIDDGSGWRLCESVLESYPPQCGGDALVVEGLDPSLFPLEEQGEVRWQTDATLVGTVDGDTLTVTGSAAGS
jgi:hypothetical protein